VEFTTHVHLRSRLKKLSRAARVLPFLALMAGHSVKTQGTLASTDMATRERQCGRRRRRRPRSLFNDIRCNR